MDTTIPQSRIDWKQYDSWRTEGRTDKAFAESIGMDANNFAQYKRRRPRPQPTIEDIPVETVDLTRNGNLPAIRATLHTAPDRTSAPDRTESALAQLDIRLQVVEAFIMAQQHASALPAHPKAPALPSAPERTEPPTWVSRGTDIAQDMRKAIDAYAAKHRLEKREALDELLRIALAHVAEGVRDA